MFTSYHKYPIPQEERLCSRYSKVHGSQYGLGESCGLAMVWERPGSFPPRPKAWPNSMASRHLRTMFVYSRVDVQSIAANGSLTDLGSTVTGLAAAGSGRALLLFAPPGMCFTAVIEAPLVSACKERSSGSPRSPGLSRRPLAGGSSFRRLKTAEIAYFLARNFWSARDQFETVFVTAAISGRRGQPPSPGPHQTKTIRKGITR